MLELMLALSLIAPAELKVMFFNPDSAPAIVTPPLLVAPEFWKVRFITVLLRVL